VLPANSWLLNLGDEWYEGECVFCGTEMLIAPGDVVTVIVGKGQEIDGTICAVCSRKRDSYVQATEQGIRATTTPGCSPGANP